MAFNQDHLWLLWSAAVSAFDAVRHVSVRRFAGTPRVVSSKLDPFSSQSPRGSARVLTHKCASAPAGIHGSDETGDSWWFAACGPGGSGLRSVQRSGCRRRTGETQITGLPHAAGRPSARRPLGQRPEGGVIPTAPAWLRGSSRLTTDGQARWRGPAHLARALFAGMHPWAGRG